MSKTTGGEKAAAQLKSQESQQLDRIAEISLRIRNAIRDSLPAPPEQFFTVMVPGKVLNFAVSSFPISRSHSSLTEKYHRTMLRDLTKTASWSRQCFPQ